MLHLDLSSTPIDDAGLKYVQELKGLGWLSLANTAVSDAGMAQLMPVPLFYLNITGSRVKQLDPELARRIRVRLDD